MAWLGQHSSAFDGETRRAGLQDYKPPFGVDARDPDNGASDFGGKAGGIGILDGLGVPSR